MNLEFETGKGPDDIEEEDEDQSEVSHKFETACDLDKKSDYEETKSFDIERRDDLPKARKS